MERLRKIVYIYDWSYWEKESEGSIRIDYLQKKSNRSRGEDGFYFLLDYRCHCYVDADLPEDKIRIYNDGIDGYVKSKFISYKDIASNKNYWKISFRSHRKMLRFCDDFKGSRYRSYIYHRDPLKLFLSCNGFSYTGWYEINIRMDTKKIESIRKYDIVKNHKPKIASFDIECLSQKDGSMPRSYVRGDHIFMISLIVEDEENVLTKYLLYLSSHEIRNEDGIKMMRYEDEISMLDALFSLLRDEDPDVLIGYNISNFDIPYILDRYRLIEASIPDFSRKGNTRLYDRQNIFQKKTTHISSTGRITIDLLTYFRKEYPKWSSHKLHDVSMRYLNEGKKKMRHVDLWKRLRSNSHETRISALNEAAIYCVYDSELTLRLFNKFGVWIDRCEVADISISHIESTINQGPFVMFENLIVDECIRRNCVLETFDCNREKEKRKIKGAHVFEPKTGLWKNGIVVIDFKGLYPSLYIAYNICASTITDSKEVEPIYKNYRFRPDVQGILPNILDRLRKYRIDVQEMEKVESDHFKRNILNRRQNAYKIIANAMYGASLLTSKYFPDLSCGETCTGKGRAYIRKVKRTIDKNPYANTIYGDTDSIFFVFTDDFFDRVDRSLATSSFRRERNDPIYAPYKTEFVSSICRDINRHLPPPILLIPDGFYEKMIMIQKKNYVTMDRDVIKYKGGMSVRRNICEFSKEIFDETCRMIFSDVSFSNIEKHIEERIRGLKNGNIDIRFLISSVSVKDIATYKTTSTPQYRFFSRLKDLASYEISTGDRIPFVVIKGNSKLLGDRYRLPEETETKEIDHAYYISQFKSHIDNLIYSVYNVNKFIDRIVNRISNSDRRIDSYFSVLK